MPHEYLRSNLASHGVLRHCQASLRRISSPSILRVAVDEVAIFFAATDHGKSVVNLTASDIVIHDNSQPPNSILAFHNESELPLRLGLIIDTSNSVTDRFHFERGRRHKIFRNGSHAQGRSRLRRRRQQLGACCTGLHRGSHAYSSRSKCTRSWWWYSPMGCGGLRCR